MDDDERMPGAPEWAVTFGDMMSLLLTFFILLVSMSEFRQEGKYQNVLDSMRQQFGHEPTMASFLPRSSLTANATPQSLAAKGRAKRNDILRHDDSVNSPLGEDGLVKTIRSESVQAAGGVVFFAENSAVLTHDAKRRLQAIAVEIADKPQRIELRGHASRNPATDARNHWTLASERASVVKDYLVELGIGPQRLRLSSAGDNEPLDNMFDIEGRQRNARVEVLLWDESVTRPNDSE